MISVLFFISGNLEAIFHHHPIIIPLLVLLFTFYFNQLG